MNGKHARRWALVLGPLLLVASGVLVLRWLSVPDPRKLPEPFREQLASRVVDALEHDPTFRAEPGHPDLWPVCVASVFGVAPDSADTVDEVRTIYTQVDCKWLSEADVAKGNAGSVTDPLFGASMPIAVRLGPPVTYQTPESGEGIYPDSIRRIFPKPLQAAAFSEHDPSMMNALDERIMHLMASSAPSPSHS
ncbi:hypothetical protein ACL02O_34180 [Micromonospora sp. MS34]|uniref:hypothetical protein n=1 Tax=Micromonospora sp. MS34 TaxID=3385971 RepID=UPI00399F2B50